MVLLKLLTLPSPKSTPLSGSKPFIQSTTSTLIPGRFVLFLDRGIGSESYHYLRQLYIHGLSLDDSSNLPKGSSILLGSIGRLSLEKP